MEPDEEEQLLRSVALQNVQSILIARQRAEQELIKTKEALEEETRILELLNQTGARLGSTLDLQSLVQAVTDAGTQLSGAQFGAFFYGVTDGEGDVLSLYTLSGAPPEAFERFGLPRATALFAPIFQGQGVIRVADVREDPRYGQQGPHHGLPPGHPPVCSYLAIPVIATTGKVLGGLFFGHSESGIFSARAERLIVGLAAQAAIAIDNARMYEEAKRAAEERARLLEAERSARREVERAGVIKDEFVATLSHELRTPLSAILGWSNILLARCHENDPSSRRGLETIARNARAQAQLIDDLLDMNRIVSGKMRLDVQRVDLASIVESALDSVQPAVDAKQLVLRRTIDPKAGPVIGDPNRLQQVVWNLLTNAVKFTPKRGKIDIILQRVNSHIEIIVQDTGVGISPEFLPHLFERFRQEDATTTRKFGGLGLGLSIVKQLVELHGGSISAESQGDGKGATFTVMLPLRAIREVDSVAGEHPSTPAPSGIRGPEISLAGVKVLVVDDEVDARELLRVVLSDAGAVVFTAASADEGLTLVKSQSPDVIVSDIGMPERDGYQFMRDVRDLGSSTGGRVPAVALTAFARSEDRTRAMLAGYQVHISKPIEPQELAATIKSLVAHSGLRP